tara:strand:+ start:223 stop:831 length:609 start_codon:yes stop_codon:yes gene_type:complete
MADDECLELKNIRYKTMLLNNNVHLKTEENINDINVFLKKDKESIKNKSWSKLSNASKLQKILLYSNKYAQDNELSKEDHEKLKLFLIDSMEKKKLQRIKDVTYDMNKNAIININGLTYNVKKKRFTLKVKGKKSNTLKSLPSLHKKNKTKRDKEKKDKKKKKDKHREKRKKESREKRKGKRKETHKGSKDKIKQKKEKKSD